MELNMRVEILTGSSRRRLEEMINERLRYYDPLEIIDIKFSGSGNHSAYSTDEYSAMIIYK